MDFKDKIIMCLVAMVVLLAIFLQDEINQKQKPESEPANEIIYNVVDENGRVIGGFILKK
jgi:hypothetical protein